MRRWLAVAVGACALGLSAWQVQVRNGNKTQWLTVKESVYRTLSKGEYYKQ